jgi:hypothetical protein
MTAAAQILTFAAAVRLMVRVKTAWQTARAAAPGDKPVHLYQFSRWLLPALSSPSPLPPAPRAPASEAPTPGAP